MADAKPKAGKQESGKQKKSEFYKIEGDKLVRHKSCPKCGPGVFMAVHEKRIHCGRCGYTEFK